MNPAEKYIVDQKEPFRSILLQLQLLIESTVPELELKYKWRIPYYYYNGDPFCFLNVSKDYVDVGFRAGANFSDMHTFLISENRKIFKSLRYRFVEEVDLEILLKVMERLHHIYKNK